MKYNNKKKLKLYPNLLLNELIVAYLVIGCVITLSVLFPVEYGEEANSLITPYDIKPEWYFLWLYEVVKLVPTLVGLSIPFILGAALFLLPLIDRHESNLPGNRRLIVISGIVVFLILVVMSIMGAFSAGG